VECLPNELLLEGLARGDVAGRDHQARNVRFVEQVRQDELHMTPGTAGVMHAQLGSASGPRRSLQLLQEIRERGLIVGVHGRQQGSAHHSVGRIAPGRLRGRALIGDGSGAGADQDDVGCVLDQRAKTILAAASRCGLVLYRLIGTPPMGAQNELKKAHQTHPEREHERRCNQSAGLGISQIV